MQKIYGHSFLISVFKKQEFYKLLVVFTSLIKQASVKYIKIYVYTYTCKW